MKKIGVKSQLLGSILVSIASCQFAFAQVTHVIGTSGDIGIYTLSPAARLDITGGGVQSSPLIGLRGENPNCLEWGHQNSAGYGSTLGFHSSSGQPYIAFHGDAGATANTFKTRGKRASIIISDNAGGIQFGNVEQANADNQSFIANMSLDAAGNVTIGSIPSSGLEKLNVDGRIKTKKLIVTQTGWSDYVFAADYKLRPLSSLKTFIKRNKHLPEVPSAKEVEETGINVGDMHALLLKKIEELTLYIIDQQEQIVKLKKEFKNFKIKNNAK
jgi:hypothetical protein